MTLEECNNLIETTTSIRILNTLKNRNNEIDFKILLLETNLKLNT